MAKFVTRKPEKEVISMRIAVDTLQEIDSKAAAVGISRNELINQMILYALSNMEEPDTNQNNRHLCNHAQGAAVLFEIIAPIPMITEKRKLPIKQKT